MDRARLGYVSAVAVGAGTAFLFAWWWSSRNKKYQIPTSWIKVGELGDIYVFPVKSFGCIRKNEIECTKLGPKCGWLRDRTLMVIDSNGKFVTARQYPKMMLIKPSVAGSVLTLNAPGMMEISVNMSSIGKSFQMVLCYQPVPACDCGEEVAKWLSHFLLQEDTGLRLVYYPLDEPFRDILSSNEVFPLMKNEDVGAYPDESAFTLMNQASIDELNSRVDETVTPLQFRMNFTIKGAKPFEEDNWDWIKIGHVIFRNVRPCTRCILTTINPETGTKHPDTEPLKTLRTYRQLEDPVLRKFTKYTPALGVHLGLKGPNGNVKLGDSVYVGVDQKEQDNSIPQP